MCVVSMITDHYREQWPMPGMYYMPEPVGYPTMTKIVDFTPPITITVEQWNEYRELKRKAEEYDARTGQPDCVKPGVEEWEKMIEAVLVKRGLILKNDNQPSPGRY